MGKLIVHILTQNRKDTLTRCLSALQATGGIPDSQVLVVDNGSNDGTAEMIAIDFSEMRYLRLDKNYGVSGGRNRGVKYLCGTWNVFLDDDCIVTPSFFSDLQDAVTQPDAGDILTLHIIQDDTEEITCWSYYPPADQFSGQRFQAHIFSGGGCAIRGEVFQSIGMLSEAYLFGAEEVDFSLRAIAADYRIMYEPAVLIRHVGLSRHPIPTQRDLLHLETVSYFYLTLLPGLFKWRKVASCLLSCNRSIFHFGIIKPLQSVYTAWQKARRDERQALSPAIKGKLRRLQNHRPELSVRLWQHLKKLFVR